MNDDFNLSLDLTIVTETWREALGRPRQIVARAAQVAFRVASITSGREAEVAVRLTVDAEVEALNRDFRHKAGPTNVLAFPALDTNDLEWLPADAPLVLGDVVIALETTLAEAEAEAKTLEDHVSHLVVHGMLHLLGHDHQTDKDASFMEQLEINALKRLGIKDPYAPEKILAN